MSRVREQYEQASRYLGGGVSSSTRVNKALGHAMLFDRAEGCRLWDLDGKDYIDLRCSHGATLLGHGDSRIRQAVDGPSIAVLHVRTRTNCTPIWPRALRDDPCVERVRFTCSGSEATMHCLRLARAFTGKTKILKFEGNFHGYHDQVMFSIGTPSDRLGPDGAHSLSRLGRDAAWPAEQPHPRAVQSCRPVRGSVTPARLRAGCGDL